MKKKHFTKAVLFSLVMAILPITSCNKDNIIDGGTYNLTFDKSELTFEAIASSDIIEILNAKHRWGVESVEIKEGEKIQIVRNEFVIESDGKNSFNVFANPFVGECFSIEKQGSKMLIKLNENNGAERKLTIAINAGPGYGVVHITQKGK